ncbi:hypothetical protein SLEP1_g40634 [Rubroshorea leprosula]|uniref:Single-stranded DNA-binding protein, mitochondrial n=1 Tax=Rubroshorea leprosula TaxID=152421 RepID=A0AAV5L435_9ROSI|nr:hypothetical protein SLEP1_g40634 [Rubroshorea leprosula]
MGTLAGRFAKLLRVSATPTPTSSLVPGLQRSSKLWFATGSGGGDTDIEDTQEIEEEIEDIIGENVKKNESLLQGVNPGKGWQFRGVHKAIICGKVGQAPVQKILRNGRTVTIFTVGTGGMYDQRISQKDVDKPKPAQWHRIAVHNPFLGTFAVQQLTKNCSVYIEGEIETRVYNDSLSGEVKYIPEICVRRDGKIHVMRPGESINNISVEDLRKELL